MQCGVKYNNIIYLHKKFLGKLRFNFRGRMFTSQNSYTTNFSPGLRTLTSLGKNDNNNIIIHKLVGK